MQSILADGHALAPVWLPRTYMTASVRRDAIQLACNARIQRND
jgi:hypothetical protein